MATVFAGGSRRSAAPSVSLVNPTLSQALYSDAGLNRLVSSMQAIGQPAQPALPGGQPQTGSQGAGNVGTTGTASGTAMANTRDVAKAMQAVGTLAKDPGLAQMGGMIGTGVSLASMAQQLGKAQSVGEVATAVAPIGLQAIGATSPVAGAIMGGITDGAPGAIGGLARGALFAAAPPLAALDTIASMLGLPSISAGIKNTVQDTKLGQQVDPSLGLLGGYQLGNAINTDTDPLGALVVALSPAVQPAAAETDAEQASFNNLGRGRGGYTSWGGGVNNSAANTGPGSGFGGGMNGGSLA